MERKMTECVCYECKKRYVAREDSVKRGRKRRGGDIDLCRECSCSTKYRKTHLSLLGKDHVNWKGGILYDNGYKKIYAGNGKYEKEHRLIVENKIKRKLSSIEQIHHIDMDRANNDINNLYVCTNKVHSSIHFSAIILGFSLIGEKIWFDYKYNVYKLQETRSDFMDVDMSEYKDFRVYKRTRKNRLIYHYYNLSKGGIKMIHTIVAEKMIGRKLYSDECVHHIDGDTENNSSKNLKVLDRKSHRAAHNSLQKCVIELYKGGAVKFDSGNYHMV